MRGIGVGIDIGTMSITTAVVRQGKDGKSRIIGVGSSPSAGMRRGSIINVEEASLSLKRSLHEASRSSGVAIRSAVIGIGGAHTGSFITRGAVAVSRPDGEITEDDVKRVIQAAEGLMPKNPNHEVIHLIPREFKIDGQGGVSDPVGMVGMKLEVEALVIYGAKPSLQNIIKCCELSGIEIEDWISSPLAAAEVLLTNRQKELGVILLDLGAGTSDFAVFAEGRVIDVGSFQIGGGHITSDIAIGFRIQAAAAEEIKLRFAQALTYDRGGKREAISLADFNGGHDSTFLVSDLSDIVTARLTDIFELSTKTLKRLGRAGLLAGGVVLTGGVADITGIQDLARRELKLPAEVAKASGMESFADVIPTRLAIPVGLILRHSGGRHGIFQERAGKWGSFMDGLKRVLRSFVP